jgi:tetratricopeptide (TPR) repeat protein
LLSDPIRLARAIRELGRFALIRIDGRAWIIHRLIQALLRDDLPPEEQERYREQAQLVLAVGGPQEPTDDRLWPRYAGLVAHVAAPATQFDQSENKMVRHFATDMVRYLYESGDLAAARSFAERFIGQWTLNPNIPEGDQQLLRVRRHRANALRTLGQFDAAHAEDAAILDIATRTFGERDSFTLQMTNSFGADLRARGDFAEALDLDLRSFTVHKELLGVADIQTLRVANNLALDYALNSRYPEARDLHNETYRLRSEGTTDIPAQEVLSSLGGLARALRLCGDFGAARDVGQEAYDFGTATLGAEHPRTFEVAIDLSIALRRITASYSDAAELASNVFEQCRARLGRFAPLTLAAIVSLTNIQRTSSQIVDALELSREAAEQFGNLFGRDHPYYHGCVGNVALLERVNGNAERARELNEQALAGLDAKLGRDHHYTLTVAVNLASDLAGVDDNAGARALGEGSLRRLRRLLGDDHPLTLGCAANLVSDLRTAGTPEEANLLFTDTLARYRATLGDDHPDTIVAAEGARLDFDFDSPQI